MKQILLVDNDAVFSRMVTFLLEKENYHVSVARDGKEATAALDTGNYDLVITDLFMPYSNGFELVNTVRSKNSTRHTPVVVLSDVANKHSIDQCLRLGANAYIQKPLNVTGLLSEIKNLVVNQHNVAA